MAALRSGSCDRCNISNGNSTGVYFNHVFLEPWGRCDVMFLSKKIQQRSCSSVEDFALAVLSHICEATIKMKKQTWIGVLECKKLILGNSQEDGFRTRDF